MKKTLTALATAGLLVGATQAAANDLGHGFSWSGNLAFTSNYIFQGMSETERRPALQGGFDVAHESGLYVGNWNSAVRFGEASPEYMEVDVYGGFATDITDHFGIDFGVIHFFYPGAGGAAEFTEVYGGVTTGYMDLGAAFYIAYETDGDYMNYQLDLDYAMPMDTFAFASLGYRDFDDDDVGEDRTYWLLGVGYSYAGLDFSVAYGDNDYSGNQEQWAFTVGTAF